MKKIISLFLSCLCLCMTIGCDTQENIENRNVNKQEENQKESDEMHQLNIIIEDTTFSASLYDNEAAHAFMEALPITLTMEDLHSNEKYYYFDASFPSAAQPVSNIQTGDIKLFGNDCLVLFYKDFPTSYSYTSLGKIEDAQGLQEAVGTGSVTVRFEKAE